MILFIVVVEPEPEKTPLIPVAISRIKLIKAKKIKTQATMMEGAKQLTLPVGFGALWEFPNFNSSVLETISISILLLWYEKFVSEC